MCILCQIDRGNGEEESQDVAGGSDDQVEGSCGFRRWELCVDGELDKMSVR
jgi:hypothetical protein